MQDCAELGRPQEPAAAVGLSTTPMHSMQEGSCPLCSSAHKSSGTSKHAGRGAKRWQLADAASGLIIPGGEEGRSWLGGGECTCRTAPQSSTQAPRHANSAWFSDSTHGVQPHKAKAGSRARDLAPHGTRPHRRDSAGGEAPPARRPQPRTCLPWLRRTFLGPAPTAAPALPPPPLRSASSGSFSKPRCCLWRRRRRASAGPQSRCRCCWRHCHRPLASPASCRAARSAPGLRSGENRGGSSRAARGVLLRAQQHRSEMQC